MTNPPMPKGFKPATNVDWCFISDAPPAFLRKTRYTGRRAVGIRYERKAQLYLAQRYGGSYMPSPWLCFSTLGDVRWCQPDGLLVYPKLRRVVVVEIKYSHTARAWWQVRKLYIPVLEKLFPGYDFRAVELVKWFDPDVTFPEATAFCPDPALVGSDHFGIHLWTP